MKFTKYFTRYHISNSLNGCTSAALHCIKKPKRQFDKALNADSNGGIFFLLRCVKPSYATAKSLFFEERNTSLMTGKRFNR